MADNYLKDDSLPTVKGGVLSKPYPIRTKGDVNRARVLPPPAPDTPAEPMKTAAPAAPRVISRDEQPKSGFDYVKKRNALQRELSGGRR